MVANKLLLFSYSNQQIILLIVNCSTWNNAEVAACLCPVYFLVYNGDVLISFIIIFVGLSVLSSFFSSAEIAYIAANKHDLEAESNKNNRGALWALSLLKEPTKFFSLVLLGNNLVNVALSAIVTIFSVNAFGEDSVFVAALLLTIFILVFCETLPKSIAVRSSQKMVLAYSYILYPLYFVFSPVIGIINKFVSLIQWLFTRDATEENKEEARVRNLQRLKGTIVDSRGSLSKSHADMLLGILDLDKIKAEDAMTPLGDITAINLDDDTAEIFSEINETKHSHLVVYRGNVNNCLGFVSKQSALLLQGLAGDNKDKLEELIDDSEYVPASVLLLNLISSLMAAPNPRAFVVDEYGSVQGIITLHDVLDETIGSINSLLMTEVSPGCFRIHTSSSLRDINNRLSWNLGEGENQLNQQVSTLQGLIQEQLEILPEGRVCFELDDYRLETEDPVNGVAEHARIWRHNKKNNR